MKKILHSLAVAIPLLLANSALAQHQTFTVDSQTSDVSIDLGGSDHSVHGTFHVQSGSIDFSRGTPSISGSVIVAAGSGKTGNDSRDKKMTNEVLDAPHFAEISFFPKSYQGTIAPTGDSTIQVTGTFARRRSTSLAMECGLCLSLNSTVSSKTDFPALFSDGIDR